MRSSSRLFNGLRLFYSMTCLWDCIICFMSSIILYWICKFIYNSIFWSSKTWFLIIISKVSRFYFDFIFFIISSRIFLVAAMDYMIWRLVISFFKVFLFVESLSVLITRDKSFICDCMSWLSSHPSVFFIRTIYPCFFLISKIFNAFCY